MMHLLNFVLAALATSKALAAPIEASAAADALVPASVSGTIAARQLSNLPVVGGLLGGKGGILRRDGTLELDNPVVARQLDGLPPVIGSLLGGNLRRGLADGSLALDNLNIPVPGEGISTLKARQGGPLEPVAAAPPRLPFPLSFAPNNGAAPTGSQEIGAGGGGGGGGGIAFPAVLPRDSAPEGGPLGALGIPLSLSPNEGDASSGTQSIGAGGGGGGGGGISFPAILAAKPPAAAAAEPAAEAPAVEDVWHPLHPTYTYTWNPEYTNTWWHEPTRVADDDDMVKGPIPTGNSANIGGHNVNLPRANSDAPAPTAPPAASTDAPSWAQWTDWQTWTSQWGQFSNGANSWTQTWDGAAASPTYTWPAWNGNQGQGQSQNQGQGQGQNTAWNGQGWNQNQGQNQNQAQPTGAVRAAVAPGPVELPPKDMNAEVGKGAISASVAAVEVKATAA
ncbi:hypothetical protein FKP32DRAFT_1606470 [Trametes sanguinea]|nr:hypothetical protein FKP32DRAFT_1606470 [Trametes sanguinea]